MNNWDTAVLGDFVKHQKGFAFKSKWFIDEGIPIVKVTDFTSSSIDKNSIQYIQEGIAEDKVKYKLKTGDSVIQTVGSWPNNPASVVGKAIQVPEELNDALLNQNAVILRPKEELKEPLDRFFLFYLLRSESYKGFIINTAQGAANQASITLDSIFRFPFYKPLLKTQKKIAAILSAYDDLIENNKRRIALLEKMAEEIYREWFVRFRFPGYQDAKFERGVPKGWKIEIVKKIVDRRKFGKIYRETDLNDMGSIVVIDQSRKDHLGFYDGEPQHRASINKPIILFGDHTCKMVLMVKDFSLAENVIPFTSKDKMPIHFLYHLIKDKAKTTEYKRHWTDLSTKTVLIPSIELQNKFSNQVVDIYQQIEFLKYTISNLNKTRDLILPRLISGKLSVEDLDIQFPPSMLEEQVS